MQRAGLCPELRGDGSLERSPGDSFLSSRATRSLHRVSTKISDPTSPSTCTRPTARRGAG